MKISQCSKLLASRLLSLATLAVLLAVAIPNFAALPQAQASVVGFQGPYAPANWTFAANGGDGSVITAGAPGSITLIGSNLGSPNFTDYTTLAAGAGLVSFSWNYISNDSDESPATDPFGYLLNGGFTQLTVDSSPITQAGTAFSFSVLAGQIFGFRIQTIDGAGGRAQSLLSSFGAPSAATPPLYWLGSNGTLWSAANNWSSNSTGIPTENFATGSDIIFSSANSTNSANTVLGGDLSIGSLTINSTNAVGISGGNLTITGSEAVTVSGTSGNVSISAPLILSGSSSTLSIENANTTLASITSANGLVKSGNGTLTLTGNNTNNSTTSINAGTLALSGNGTLGTSTISIAGGTLDMGGKSLANTLGNLTAGTLANGTLTNNGSNYNLQNGTVSATLAGTNGVNKTTSGTVTLSGSNTYNGTTTISAGTLNINSSAAIGTGTLTILGGAIGNTGNTSINLSNLQNWNGDFTFSGPSDMTLGGNVTMNASRVVTVSGGNLTVGGVVAGTGFSLTKNGTGTLTLNGNNTYSGGTFIQSGTLAGNSDGLKGTITNNATLLLGGASPYTYQLNTTGVGALRVIGTVTLLGNATMSGGTTIQSGTLTIGGLLPGAVSTDTSAYRAGSITGNISNEGSLIFDQSTANRTYSGVISGNGSLQTIYINYSQGYNGQLFLTNNNTFTGGTFVSVGTVDISGGSLSSTGNVSVSGGVFSIGASNQAIGQLILTGGSATGTGSITAQRYNLQQGSVSLGLAGMSDIEKNTPSSQPISYDNGIVYLSGNNTSGGNITISSGILSFNNVQSLYSGNTTSWTKEKISVSANATLALGTGGGSATSGFNNAQIAVIFNNLTQNGTGGLAANSKIGFNTTSDFTLTANITDRPDGGAIGVDKIGDYTLVLDSNNTFSGGLSIFQGVVALGRDNALLPNSNIVIDSRTSGVASSGFDVGIYTQQFKDVTLKRGLIAGTTGAVSATGNYTMIKGDATANLSGNASLIKTNTSGSSYNVYEPESVFLSGNNSYTGRTIVDGVVWTGQGNNTPSSNPGAPTALNAKLQFQTVNSLYGGNETLWSSQNISVDSYGIFSLRTGSAGFNATQVSTIIQNLITANRSSTSGGFLDKSMLGIDTNGEDLVIDGAIGDTTGLATGGGAVGLIKYGSGTLTLNGNSTRSFSTSVTGGNLVLGANATLSSASANLLVDNAMLNIAATNQTVRKVTVTSGSIIGSGTLTSSADGFVFGNATVSANLAGAVGAVIDSSSGTTTLSGNNSFTGNTTIGSSATLSLANVNALAGSTLVFNDITPTANLQFSAGTTTYNLGGLAGTGNLSMGANSLSIGANSQNTTYSAILSGTGSITKVANGTLTLTGENAYTGGTTITMGTLSLGNGNATGSVTGDITNNAALVFNRSGNVNYSNTISGTGNVTKQGSGTLYLTGNSTYTGSTTISAGALQLSGSLASSSLNIASGATLTNYSGSLSSNSTLANLGTFWIRANTTVGSISGNGNVNLYDGGNFTTGGLNTNDEFSGLISAISSPNSKFTKVGNGNLTLTGSVTNLGGLVISNGIVSIGNGSTTGSVTGNITNNAALVFNRSNNSTYSGNITGNGDLTKLGNGTLILTSNNTYTGNTTISVGTLQLGNGSTSGWVSGDIINNATLAINRSDDIVFANSLTGTGSVIKMGNNKLTYSSTTSPQGGTTVNAGTLLVTGTTSSVTVNNSGILAGNGTTGDVVINSGGAIAPGSSPGTLRTGNMTWNGGGIYNWELASANGTSPGTDWDFINSTGSLTIGANATNQFTIAASTTNASGFDPNAKRASWKIAEFGGGITDFASDTFNITTSGFGALPSVHIFYVSQEGHALNFNYATMATWNTGNGTWSNASNWVGESRPVDGVTVEYASSNGTGGVSTYDNTGNYTLADIYGLQFSSGHNHAYTIAGGNLTIGAGGIVNNSNSTQTIALNLALGANQTFAANTANLVVSGIISGNSTLTKSGNSTLTLSGNNTYSGGTTISVGTLALGGTEGAITGNISVASGATFAVNRTNDFTLSNIVSGAGSFAQIGTSTTNMTAVNTYTGGTTISSGTLWVNNSQALGTGNVQLNNGTLLITSAQESIMGNQTLSIGSGNLNWTSGSIAFYDTGTSPLSGDLTIRVGGNFTASAGNKTFDFSRVEALDFGSYTLVNATTISANGTSFLAAHGNNTILIGNFTTTNNTVVYTVTGATSSGTNIQNNGGPNTPVVANYSITAPTITIGADNKVSALTFSANNSLTINATGNLTVNAGNLTVTSGSSVVSGGTLLAPNGFNKDGAGELKVSNNVLVNGTAAVNAGLLSVNGNFSFSGGSGNISVGGNGTLGGNGSITGNVLVAGGNLAPGNSPGNLTVAGNLVLTGANSTIIEIAGISDFDKITVTGGQATLGGNMSVVQYNGYQLAYGQRYDILTATGGITGNFSAINMPVEFVNSRGRFLINGTTGTLLIAPLSYVPLALNQNQRNVAAALDTFIPVTSGDRLAVSIALDSQTAGEYPSAFNQIMPGIYESLRNMAIEQSFNQNQLLNQRTSSVRLGVSGFQALGGLSQPLVYDSNGKRADQAKTGPIVENAMATNWNAWVLGTGMFSRTTSIANVQNYDNNAGGFLLGADYRWNENFVTGLYTGYDYSKAKYAGGSSTKGNAFNFGSYASYEKNGYYADGVLGGGFTSYQTKRSIKFSTIDRKAKADPNSGQFTAGANFGKDWKAKQFTFGPVIGAHYTFANIGGFKESGADSLNLAIGQQDAHSFRTTLGGRLAYNWDMNKRITLVPEIRISWMHEFMNNPRDISNKLDGGNGASFNYETTTPYRDSANAGTGVTAQFNKSISSSVFYNVNLGSQSFLSNTISLSLNFGF